MKILDAFAGLRDRVNRLGRVSSAGELAAGGSRSGDGEAGIGMEEWRSGF